MRNITLEKVVRFGVGLIAVGVVGLIMYNYSTLVAYLILAMILSYILDPFVNRLQRMGLNRTLGITLTLSGMILLLVFISTNIIPLVVEEMLKLSDFLTIERIESIAIDLEIWLTTNYTFIPEGYIESSISQIAETLFNMDRITNVLNDALGLFTNIFSAILVVPFAAFFFIKDGSKIRRDVLTLIPNKYFETTLTLIDKIEKRLGLYFRSVLAQSFLVAIISWTTLSIAGLENSLSVGITVGVANTIPYFGPIIGYILSIIVSLIETGDSIIQTIESGDSVLATGDFNLVIMSIIAIFITQMIDNLVLQPFLFSRSADMHPVAILFIILIGAETAGILGMLVAIPIATTVKITINQISWSFNNYQVFRLENSPTPFNSS